MRDNSPPITVPSFVVRIGTDLPEDSFRVLFQFRLSHLAVVAGSAFLFSATPPDMAREAVPSPASPFKAPANALFADDFSKGLERWSTDRDSVWSVRQGMLRADLPDEKQERSFLYAGSEDWSDYAVDLDVCGMRGVDKGVVVRVEGTAGVGVDLRGPGYQDVVMYRREWPMGRASVVNGNGMWHHLRVECRGPRYRVFVDGALKLTREDSRLTSKNGGGRIALAAYTGGVGQCTIWYDNVVVTPLP